MRNYRNLPRDAAANADERSSSVLRASSRTGVPTARACTSTRRRPWASQTEHHRSRRRYPTDLQCRRSLAIVFNGEIYNYKELRAELYNRTTGSRTQSDTEVIVHLYDQLGEERVHKLNGMFAFAIWDNRTRFRRAGQAGRKALSLLAAGRRHADFCERNQVVTGNTTWPKSRESTFRRWRSISLRIRSVAEIYLQKYPANSKPPTCSPGEKDGIKTGRDPVRPRPASGNTSGVPDLLQQVEHLLHDSIRL